MAPYIKLRRDEYAGFLNFLGGISEQMDGDSFA